MSGRRRLCDRDRPQPWAATRCGWWRHYNNDFDTVQPIYPCPSGCTFKVIGIGDINGDGGVLGEQYLDWRCNVARIHVDHDVAPSIWTARVAGRPRQMFGRAAYYSHISAALGCEYAVQSDTATVPVLPVVSGTRRVDDRVCGDRVGRWGYGR